MERWPRWGRAAGGLAFTATCTALWLSRFPRDWPILLLVHGSTAFMRTADKLQRRTTRDRRDPVRLIAALAWTAAVGWAVYRHPLQSVGPVIVVGFALYTNGRAKVRVRRGLPPLEPEPPPPPVDAPLIANRIEAVLLLALPVLAAGLLAMIAVPPSVESTQPLIFGWTLGITALGAPGCFVAYALVIARRLKRKGLGTPSTEQFLSKAAFHAALATLRTPYAGPTPSHPAG